MVPRRWPDSTIVCIATGPSLTAEDVELARGQHVVVINDSYRLAPWADVLYAADARWWKWQHESKDTQGLIRAFQGARYSLQDGASAYGATILRNTGDRGLEREPCGLRTGQNSGYQAVNLAVHLGASRILLLGYDMQRLPGRPGHWFGEHPDKNQSQYASFLERWPSMIQPLRDLGVEVINCSRDTALTCFPMMDFSAALAAGQVAA